MGSNFTIRWGRNVATQFEPGIPRFLGRVAYRQPCQQAIFSDLGVAHSLGLSCEWLQRFASRYRLYAGDQSLSQNRPADSGDMRPRCDPIQSQNCKGQPDVRLYGSHILISLRSGLRGCNERMKGLPASPAPGCITVESGVGWLRHTA